MATGAMVSLLKEEGWHASKVMSADMWIPRKSRKGENPHSHRRIVSILLSYSFLFHNYDVLIIPGNGLTMRSYVFFLLMRFEFTLQCNFVGVHFAIIKEESTRFLPELAP